MQTYTTYEEATERLVKDELRQHDLDPSDYDLPAFAEEVIYDYSEGAFAGPESGFGLHPELTSGTFWELLDDFQL